MAVNRLSILHIDDDLLWSGWVEPLVRSVPGVLQYTHCSTGAEGLNLAQRQHPDIVLLDLRLPDADGFTVAAQLAQMPVAPRLLLLSARADDAALFRAAQPHITGLVGKSPEIARQLPVAIGMVAAGRHYFPPEVREQMRQLRANPQAFYKILSDREIELLPGFGLGLTDRDLATRTGLRPLTVKSHRQHVMAKLGLHRTPELIHWAIEHGFVAPPSRIGWVQEDAGEN